MFLPEVELWAFFFLPCRTVTNCQIVSWLLMFLVKNEVSPRAVIAPGNVTSLLPAVAKMFYLWYFSNLTTNVLTLIFFALTLLGVL